MASPPLYGSDGRVVAADAILGRRPSPRKGRGLFDVLTDADKGLRHYAGPHAYNALEALTGLASMFSPAADVIDAKDNYQDAIESARAGDVPGAVANTGYGLLSNMGLSELSAPVKAIFAGVGAKTADLAKLKRAEELEGSGADATQIWNDTGWFRGADGEWRFEIDDSAAEFQNPGPRAPLRDTLKHPDLYEAYPDLAPLKVRVEALDGTVRGQYGGRAGSPYEEIALSPSSGDPRSVMLHESQHAVQSMEGFDGGANPRSGQAVGPEVTAIDDELGKREGARKLIEAAYERYGHLPGAHLYYLDMLKGLDAEMAQLRAARKRAAGFENYRRSSGEVEARNVQTRRSMSAEERKAAPPWTTEDVPRDRQIVRFR